MGLVMQIQSLEVYLNNSPIQSSSVNLFLLTPLSFYDQSKSMFLHVYVLILKSHETWQ